MGLLDSYEPQGFAARGGLLGRLLSLRPDLAEESEGADQPGFTQQAQAPASSSSSPAASAISSVLGDLYRQTILQPIKDIPGYVNDAIHDPAYFAHAIGPSLGGLGPIVSQLPAAVKGAMGAVGLAGAATRPNGDSVGNAISPAGSPMNGSLRPATVGSGTTDQWPIPVAWIAGRRRNATGARGGCRPRQPKEQRTSGWSASTHRSDVSAANAVAVGRRFATGIRAGREAAAKLFRQHAG
jgi:hypothetical protein